MAKGKSHQQVALILQVLTRQINAVRVHMGRYWVDESSTTVVGGYDRDLVCVVEDRRTFTKTRRAVMMYKSGIGGRSRAQAYDFASSRILRRYREVILVDQ